MIEPTTFRFFSDHGLISMGVPTLTARHTISIMDEFHDDCEALIIMGGELFQTPVPLLIYQLNTTLIWRLSTSIALIAGRYSIASWHIRPPKNRNIRKNGNRRLIELFIGF